MSKCLCVIMSNIVWEHLIQDKYEQGNLDE